MIHTTVSIERAVKILNEALALDSTAIRNLVVGGSICNQELAAHESMQVRGTKTSGVFEIGLLGILNGIFGADIENWGCIAAKFDEDGKLLEFFDNERR